MRKPRAPTKPLTLELIKAALHYDAETGDLVWKVRGAYRRNPGDVAGSINAAGYRQVGLHGTPRLAHRLAWAIAHDVWPIPHQIDHINLCRSDNRLCNLRAADNAQNNSNRRMQRNNTTGAKGVKRTSCGYFASIMVRGVNHYLGHFKTLDEASDAYKRAAARLHGEFCRTD